MLHLHDPHKTGSNRRLTELPRDDLYPELHIDSCDIESGTISEHTLLRQSMYDGFRTYPKVSQEKRVTYLRPFTAGDQLLALDRRSSAALGRGYRVVQPIKAPSRALTIKQCCHPMHDSSPEIHPAYEMQVIRCIRPRLDDVVDGLVEH
jgi:hypothetical protein